MKLQFQSLTIIIIASHDTSEKRATQENPNLKHDLGQDTHVHHGALHNNNHSNETRGPFVILGFYHTTLLLLLLMVGFGWPSKCLFLSHLGLSLCGWWYHPRLGQDTHCLVKKFTEEQVYITVDTINSSCFLAMVLCANAKRWRGDERRRLHQLPSL